MEGRARRLSNALIAAWTAAAVVFIYLPTLCITLASLTARRYFQFPIRRWGLEWWHKTFSSIEIRDILSTSITMAACVAVAGVLLGFFGALAFARYDWRGRRLYQKLILLPIFFPQSVLGLALLLWFNALGLPLSWKTAVFAHLVWIVPVVTLVMSIQVYGFDPALEEAAFDLGASRWQVLREVTLPVLFPGLFSGALFAFLLSWGNLPLSLFTTAAGAAHRRRLLLRPLGDHRFGGDQQARDRGRILQRRPHDLGRVDDAGLDHVGVDAGLGVVAPVDVLLVEQLADDDRAVGAGVLGDQPGRDRQRLADDLDADLLVVVVGLQLVEHAGGIEQRHAAARDDAFLDRGAGRVHRVVDAILALLHLDLGGAADPDHR